MRIVYTYKYRIVDADGKLHHGQSAVGLDMADYIAMQRKKYPDAATLFVELISRVEEEDAPEPSLSATDWGMLCMSLPSLASSELIEFGE